MRRRWPPLLVSALALVVTIPAAAAPKIEPRISAATVQFELRSTNGFVVAFENYGQQITLTVLRRQQYASYSVRGRVSADGDVDARFGSLGRISLDFEPDRVAQNPCREELEGRAGTFVGKIAFTGERGYVRLRAERVKGTAFMPRAKVKGCRSEPLPSERRGSDQIEEEEAESADTATLTVYGHGKRRVFSAIGTRSPGYSYTYFVAGTDERRGPMRVSRAAWKSARSPTFVFDSALSTATVRPPEPFQGDGAFARNADGSTTWTGTVTVPLLGTGRTIVAGPRSKATMVRDLPGD